MEKSEEKEIEHQIKNINSNADKLKKMIEPSYVQMYSLQTVIIIALPIVLDDIIKIINSNDEQKRKFKDKLEEYKWRRIE